MRIFPVLIVLILVVGCGPAANQGGEERPEEKGDSLSTVSAVNRTYLKVYHVRLPDTTYSDTMYLELQVDNAAASGKYLWFIPQKDGKFGTITGRLVKDTINGHYAYQQEGGNYTDSVQIVLLRDKAIVTQFNAPNHRLVDTLELSEQ